VGGGMTLLLIIHVSDLEVLAQILGSIRQILLLLGRKFKPILAAAILKLITTRIAIPVAITLLPKFEF
jgi:hypothetical protein